MAERKKDQMERKAPSQAEGEEQTVDETLSKKELGGEENPSREKPSQAEGSRELVEEELDENRLD